MYGREGCELTPRGTFVDGGGEARCLVGLAEITSVKRTATTGFHRHCRHLKQCS